MSTMNLLIEPFNLSVQPEGNPTLFNVSIVSPFTTIVGANASGKSRFLRALRNSILGQLPNGHRDLVFLSSSRLASVDQYRLDTVGTNSGIPQFDQSNLGGTSHKPYFPKSEGVNRMFFRLEERPDLLLKVQTRLEYLFNRSISLDWEDGYLRPKFMQTDSVSKYSMAREASGLIHIFVLLAAAYDPDVKVLMIDEPEISLHPQYQSFLFRELRNVAGDYRIDQNKKLIIIATHSPAMVPLEDVQDLPGMLFCQSSAQAPFQINPDESALNSKGIRDFVKNSLRRRKDVLFSAFPILVEGESDLKILETLENHLKFHLDASGAHPIALQGKGKLNDAMKIFALMGKKPFAVTDLDVISDSGSVPQIVSQNPVLIEHATEIGHKDFSTFTNSVYRDFCKTVDDHWNDIQNFAEKELYWLSAAKNDQGQLNDERLTKRRAAMAALIRLPVGAIMDCSNPDVWRGLRNRLDVLISTLELGGWFLMKGILEDHYAIPPTDTNMLDKIETADSEVDQILNEDTKIVRERYQPMVKALEAATARSAIDEAFVVRQRLLSVLSPALLRLDAKTTTTILNQSALANNSMAAQLFQFERIGDEKRPGIRVQLTSQVLAVGGFPLDIYCDENPNQVVAREVQST
jgi:predicted ATPase